MKLYNPIGELAGDSDGVLSVFYSLYNQFSWMCYFLILRTPTLFYVEGH